MPAIKVIRLFSELLDIAVTRAASVWIRLNTDGSVSYRTAAQTRDDLVNGAAIAPTTVNGNTINTGTGVLTLGGGYLTVNGNGGIEVFNNQIVEFDSTGTGITTGNLSEITSTGTLTALTVNNKITINNSVSLESPTAGTAFIGNINRFGMGDDSVVWRKGGGSPEGAITASVGSFYSQTDGAAGSAFWVKESGSSNTGWAVAGSTVPTLTVSGASVNFAALPTSDPAVAGRLWRSGNDVKISTG